MPQPDGIYTVVNGQLYRWDGPAEEIGALLYESRDLLAQFPRGAVRSDWSPEGTSLRLVDAELVKRKRATPCAKAA